MVPLVVNIAAKKNGISTSKTLGEENIQKVADYREFDLDELLTESEFSVFTSEILVKRLSEKFKIGHLIPFRLNEPDDQKKRKEVAYKSNILEYVKNIFPGYSWSELAEVLFEDAAIVERIFDQCKTKLQFSNEQLALEEVFKDKKSKIALTLLPSLFARNYSTTRIFSEYKKHCENLSSEFEGWIQNNFIGCYLWAYNIQNKIPPLYSGFDTIVLMSRGSIRHFLEFTYKSLHLSEGATMELVPVVPQSIQAKAIRLVSSQLVGEIRSFGRFGNRLYSFLNAIGQIFFFSQMRMTQSEPEITHFSLQKESLEKRDEEFLAEAEKWSVLYQTSETKVKSGEYSVSREYVVNPIYSSYYLISFRKKRRLDLPYDLFVTLAHESASKQRGVIDSYKKRFGDIDDTQQMLFNS